MVPLRLLQQATILCYQCNRQLLLENVLISGIEHGVFIGTIRECSRSDVLMEVHTSSKMKDNKTFVSSIVLLVTSTFSSFKNYLKTFMFS